MSRPMLAPMVVALSALLVTPQIQAEPTAPLFVVEQQRSVVVTRLAKQWSDAFAAMPKERRLTHEQLSSALWALRADRLFAVTLAGEVEAIEAVLDEGRQDARKPRVAAKALGDQTAELAYTPINPCRILDTRSTVAGPLVPNVARTFDGYATNFASQGGTGSGCGIPNGVAALAMNVYAVNPTNLGFIKVWPANATEPDVSTVNYQVGITAIATGTLVPVNQANSNQFTAKSPAVVDFIADVVGYFKPPGDATSLDIKVGGQRVMRYEYNAISPNVIGGSPANGATAGVRGATIAGSGVPSGYIDPDVEDEAPNRVTDHYGTIGGGFANRAGDDDATLNDAPLATVGGGTSNMAGGAFSTISGGQRNIVSAIAIHGAIGGGFGNEVWEGSGTVAGGVGNVAGAGGATVAGGQSNTAGGYYSAIGGGMTNVISLYAYIGAIAGGQSNNVTAIGGTVGGGLYNTASGSYSVVPGGQFNVASGAMSQAAGYRAKTQTAAVTPAIHDGAFVWSDSSDFDFHSSAANQFAVRATGGVRFVTAIDGTGVPTWTCGVSGGAGSSWGCTSDRNLKSGLTPLDGIAVLERLAALPVYQWVAKGDPRHTPHAGPTAQDFMAAFGLGDNDKMIGIADAQGVAFAAIQGLNAKLEEREAAVRREVEAKDAEIAALKKQVADLREAQQSEIAELRRAVEVLLTRTSPEGRVAVGR